MKLYILLGAVLGLFFANQAAAHTVHLPPFERQSVVPAGITNISSAVLPTHDLHGVKRVMVTGQGLAKEHFFVLSGKRINHRYIDSQHAVVYIQLDGLRYRTYQLQLFQAGRLIDSTTIKITRFK